MAAETVIHLFSSLAHSGRREIGQCLSVKLGPPPMLPTIHRSASLFFIPLLLICKSSHMNTMADEVNCTHFIHSSRHAALINEWWGGFFILGWILENLSIPKMEGNCASLTHVRLILLFVLKMSEWYRRLKQERNNMTKKSSQTQCFFFTWIELGGWISEIAWILPWTPPWHV